MPARDVLQRQKIAHLRVHVERMIRRVKENKLRVPLSISGNINELFSVACLLVNFQNKTSVKIRGGQLFSVKDHIEYIVNVIHIFHCFFLLFVVRGLCSSSVFIYLFLIMNSM